MNFWITLAGVALLSPWTTAERKWVWGDRGDQSREEQTQETRRDERRGAQERYEIEEYPDGGPQRPPIGGFGPGPGIRPGFNPGYRPGLVGGGINPGGPGFGPGIRPGGPGFGLGVGPGIGPGPVNPGFGFGGPQGGYGAGGGVLTGPVPSWEREPPIKHFDRCKCTEKFNCNSPGVSYGHCDVGKKYCCYNSHRDPHAGGPIPATPIHSLQNGILSGPGGPVDNIPGGGLRPGVGPLPGRPYPGGGPALVPGGPRPYPRPGPYDLGNGVTGPGGYPGYPGQRPGFRPDGFSGQRPYRYGYSPVRPDGVYDSYGRSANDKAEGREDNKE